MRDERWLWSTVLIGLIAMTQGCSLRLDAPCVGDEDCQADGEICLDGRCGAERCIDGDERACLVAEAGDCRGRQSCVDGRFESCRGPDELCDGQDNDCDGAVDEDFAALGDPCERGEGLCAAQGAVICEADGRGAMCDATPGPSGAETCDGQDDDCDGAVDEDTDGGGCDTGLPGSCGDGVARCLDGALRCDAPGAAAPDLCDGVDDDCDGRIDEAAAEADDIGEPCTVGIGACAVEGVRICGLDGPTCDAVPTPPQAEVCGNRLDDDCDGSVDDPVSCIAGCGNGRRDLREGCDDGNALDGDGCSAACAVESGFVCREGPSALAVAIDGRVHCDRWLPVEAVPWSGGYGIAYAGGAVAFSGELPRYAAAYSVRALDGERRVDLHVGREPGGRFHETETPEEAEVHRAGAFDVLAPGTYDVTFPDHACADNSGRVHVEFRALDDCRPTCEADLECRRFGSTCVEGVCAPPSPFCGDGRLVGDEQCDDGNTLDGDGCSAACAREPGALCLPAARFTSVDSIPFSALPASVWEVTEAPPTTIQRANGRPGHIVTTLPISDDYVTRFGIQVGSGFDDDHMGWTIGGGDTPLSDPAEPYLLFSWKQWAQSEPGFGLSERGLRVARVDGALDGQTLWAFEGENFEALARGRTLGEATYIDRQVYTVEIIGDDGRLLVYVDGILEFDLADPPLGDGRLGIYANSQEGVFAELLAPLEMQTCD